MASAGRILIMPKGNWDANTEYEMLDLVFAKNTSWLAKKNSVGIEPSVENAEYWFLLCESKNLDEVNQRLAAIENQLLSAITLDDIPEVDLSGYATKSELSGYATKTDLSGYAVKSELSSYATKTDLGSYATKTDLGTVNTAITAVDEKANWIHDRTSALESAVSGLDSRIPSSENKNKLNYSGEVKRSYGNLPYTCPSAGEITVHIKDDTSSSGEAYLKINKNDKPAAYLTLSSGTEMASIFPVAKGDVINRNGAAGNISEGWIIFTPYI